MSKWLIPVLASGALLAGCATNPHGSIPVVESGSSITEEQEGGPVYQAQAPAAGPAVQALPEDSGVVVMVPQQSSSRIYPAGETPLSGTVDAQPATSSGIVPGPVTDGSSSYAPSSSYSPPGHDGSSSYTPPVASAPSGIPQSGSLAADEQLDGPVLALLTTAQQQQGSGDLNGAASSLERAQRIAPREPQVLYRLAEVRLAQGDAAQAEQVAQRALTYAGGRPTLQASLWELIAQARERQGNAAGAAQARERARVSL
ncbi:tetratricopeptide repeat protein [Zestomonas thermotolerans]|uniref:tetratricopeptide repeat protein n=1 Tax=Zestomonas thermotolerans TaxID=157784 RepID=UPI0023F555FC|nr:tetratricopeptide repeat protein [Pseudomonas thermotolerans]